MIVLIPAYEPDGRLLALVDDLRTAEPDVHLLVVDDGSGPAYRPLFDTVLAAGGEVLVHHRNQGKGAALKTGFRHALRHRPGEDIVCADSDGQHSVVDILRVADRVRRGDSLLLGARQFAGAVPARSRIGNSATRTLFRLATGRNLQDTQTGLRGYSAVLLPWLLSVPGDRFEYELDVLLQAARRGMAIAEVEIATIYLEHNASSHFRPLVDSLRVYAPLLRFLLSSFAAFLVDTAALLALQAVTGDLLVSVVGARALSSSVNFAVNRRLVFGGSCSRGSSGAAGLRYALLVGALLGANYTVLLALSGTGLPLLAAKLITEALLVGVSYLAQRHLVFRCAGQAPATRDDPAVAPRPRRPSVTGVRTADSDRLTGTYR